MVVKLASHTHYIALNHKTPLQTPTAIMPLRCCIVCRAKKSLHLQLQYCSRCQSALYCSEVCQKKDWSKQHKKLCKHLNVGHGDMQVRTDTHTSRSIALKEQFETLRLEEDGRRFVKLFQESTFEGSQAAARKMKEIAKRQNKNNQRFLLFHSLQLLARSSNSEMLSWPNSPLLVLLQFVDPSVQEGQTRFTPLHMLASLADPFAYSTHENQLILAKQLIEHGANVNAVSSDGKTSLHSACSGGNVTNLDFIELLLKAGADPNAQDHLEITPLMCTTTGAPGAAKFLLNWPTTDVNITSRSGESFLSDVRSTILPDNPDKVQHQFLLQQWHEIEGMLVGRVP
jgi:hypothetical protein